jgi:hypothetical protein
MDDVLAQGGEEMSFAVNEALVQTLPARGANPALRERVRPRRPRWRAHDPHAFRREDASNDPTNFVSRSRIRNVNWAVRSPRYSLDQVNEGYADMLAGKNIRGVIVNSH